MLVNHQLIFPSFAKYNVYQIFPLYSALPSTTVDTMEDAYFNMFTFLYLDKPNVLYKPANDTIVQNSSVTIPCGIVVSGVDVLDYFWLLNGRQLDLSSPQYMMREGNITITNLQAEDEGIYKCLANLSLTDSMANDLHFPVGSGIISVICKFSMHLYLFPYF